MRTAVVFPAAAGAAEEEEEEDASAPRRPTQQHEQRLCCRIGPTGSHGALALQVPVSARMHMRPLLHVGLRPDLTLELALGPQPQEAAAEAAAGEWEAGEAGEWEAGAVEGEKGQAEPAPAVESVVRSALEAAQGTGQAAAAPAAAATPLHADRGGGMWAAAGTVGGGRKRSRQQQQQQQGDPSSRSGSGGSGGSSGVGSSGISSIGEGGGEGSNKRHCHAPDGVAAGPDRALPRAFGGEAARRPRGDVGLSVEEVGAGLSPPVSFAAATAEAARSKPPASQHVPPSRLPSPHSPAGPPPPPPREPEPAELQAVWRLMLQVPAAQMQAAHALERRRAVLAAAVASPAAVPAADGGPALSRFRCSLREVVGLLLRARVATLLPATRLSCGPGAGGRGACRCGALRLLGSCAPALPCCCWRSAAHYLVAACEAVADCYGALADAAERDAEEGSGRGVQQLGQEEHKRKQASGNGEEEVWDEQEEEEEWDDDEEEDRKQESVDRVAPRAAGSGGRGTSSAAAAPPAVAAGCSAAEQLAGRMEGAVEAVRDVLAEALGRLWRQQH